MPRPVREIVVVLKPAVSLPEAHAIARVLRALRGVLAVHLHYVTPDALYRPSPRKDTP